MSLGKTITALRFEKGIYQKELAAYLNLSVSTISNYEQDVHCPDYSTLCKIADYFNVTTDYLLGRSTVRYSTDILEIPLNKTYTVSDLINTTLEFTPTNLDALLDYVNYLKGRN